MGRVACICFPQDERYGIINDQQKHVFGLLFDEVDKDKNGSVTLQELKLRMQPAVSRHDIKHFVQVLNHLVPSKHQANRAFFPCLARVVSCHCKF